MISGILDTNIVVDLLRGFPDAVRWYASLQPQQIGITPIVWFEVLQGAKNQLDQSRNVKFLLRFPIEHSTVDDNEWAMVQFAHYRLSYGLEYADAMIASVAVRLNVPLYTRNTKHYIMLPDVDEIAPY